MKGAPGRRHQEATVIHDTRMDVMIGIRVLPQEKRALILAAREKGVSLSDLVRDRVLHPASADQRPAA